MNESGIFLGLLVLAYIFVTPFVLIILYTRQRKTVRWLEDELLLLRQRFDEYREQMSRRFATHHEQSPDPAGPASPETVSAPAQVPVEAVMGTPVVEADLNGPETAAVIESLPAQQPVEKPAGNEVADPVEGMTITPVGEKIRVFLQGIGMWPPSREAGMDRETVLMQWWLPRAGGVLALLSALFFGVYINQNTSPLFKCLELCAVSLGLTGIGWFMERRYRAFGGVLLVTGLIMLYLTSVAAYILPATRVIDNPVTGSLVQGAILGGICAVAVYRQSRGLILLTFHFGYFLGLFMVHEGLREGALIETGLLFVAGMFLVRKPIYRQLAWVLVVGSFLVVLAFPLLSLFASVDLPGSISVQAYTAIVLAGSISAYYAGLLGRDRSSRWILSLATSLAIASTLVFFRELYPDELEWACLSLGVVMLAGAMTGWARRGCGFAVQLLFIKASFLIAVWAILYFAGDLRWMVLALQTVVVATAARRARVIALEILVWAVALASLVYFADAISQPVEQGTFVWWMMTLYPIVITLAFAWLMNVFASTRDKSAKFNRAEIYAFVPLVAIGLWHAILTNTSERGFDLALPFIAIVYVAGALSLVPFFSRWMLLELAGLAFVTGSVLYCDEPFSLLQLAGILAAAAIALHFITRRKGKWAVSGESALYFLSIVPVALWMLQVMDDWNGQAIIVFGLCGMIVLSGLVPRVRQSGSWAFLPLVAYMVTENPADGAGFLNIAAIAAGLGWLAVPAVFPNVKEGMGWASKKDIWVLIGGILFWVYVLAFGDPSATWMAGQWVMGILAILLLLASHKWKLHGYLLASLLFTLTLAARHAAAMGLAQPYVPWISEALMSAALLYAFSLMWFWLKPNPFAGQPVSVQRQFLVFSSGSSAILLFATSAVTFQYSELGWLEWYTPILAVTAFIMILIGLFFKDTVYRRLGLVALLVPLVRLFLVDVQDVLHRIIAFAASAILLTLLGYLYHRLSSHLSKD